MEIIGTASGEIEEVEQKGKRKEQKGSFNRAKEDERDQVWQCHLFQFYV